VLHAGPWALSAEEWSAEEWSAEDRAALAAEEEIRGRESRRLVGVLAGRSGVPRDEIAVSLVDLPIAVVRRHLPSPAPDSASDLVRRLASRILLPTGDPVRG